jgi:hypothetical protein
VIDAPVAREIVPASAGIMLRKEVSAVRDRKSSGIARKVWPPRSISVEGRYTVS